MSTNTAQLPPLPGTPANEWAKDTTNLLGSDSNQPMATSTDTPAHMSTSTDEPAVQTTTNTVPHAETAPLLLIFAMRAHPRGPRVLLPGLAGAAADMLTDVGAAARMLAGSVGLDARVAENQGAWRNALALGVKDESVVEALRFVWEATVEARRLALRGGTR